MSTTTTTTSPPTPPVAPAPRGLAVAYAPANPALDEMTEADGSLRAHWRSFVSAMDDLGHDEVHARHEQARRLIRENGITHNVYDSPSGHARPWSLDLLPLVLPEAEWRSVGDGLAQRARLLNALLADLYGPATAVSQGLLPPELVYANKAFLRPAHGIEPPRGTWLHLYAADVARAAGGAFSVLSDRTQAPSGAGYSLENRIVVHRVLPTVFAQCNVMRLAPFFIALQRTLASLAPPARENPRVVVLTPGQYNETYFEHAYLARYLGYALVQGNDLTVRDGRVYLKTLGGLRRVDVILRRVDDDYCDPLELFPDSFLGVPGLLQAVRDGAVAVANAIGSGAVQGPAFMRFLPQLCRHFLDEDLRLPSVRTWWCGEPEDLRYVLHNLAKLVIKPAIPVRGGEPVFGGAMAKSGLGELADRIRARPAGFVAQEYVDSYMTPVLVNGQAQPRRFTVRAFLAADGDGYAVMPGGLTRFTDAADSLVVSLQKGGGSKDTWVRGEGPVAPVSLLAPSSAPVALSRVGSDLPSRAADDLFWLGRYAQRAESVARLARVAFDRLADPNSVESPAGVQALVDELVGRHALPPGPPSPRTLAAAVFDPADPTWLRSSAKRFHGLARVLRDRISIDAWRILQSLDRDLNDFDASEVGDDGAVVVIELLNRLVTGFLAFEGMAAESMTRGQAWRFLDMGTRIERGLSLARLVRATLSYASPAEPFLLDAVLETADSSLTYRRRYLTVLEATPVVDLLVADESNPRSIAFQAKALEEHLSALPRGTDADHPQLCPDLQSAIRLRSSLRLEDLQTACEPAPPDGWRGRLDGLLADAQDHLGAISERVAQVFFSHAAVAPRPLARAAAAASLPAGAAAAIAAAE